MAGIKAIQCAGSRVNTVNQISDESTIINSIANKVIEKLQSTGLSAATGGIDEEEVNYAGMTRNRGRGGQAMAMGLASTVEQKEICKSVALHVEDQQ